jgi:hypothetical protein
MKRAINAGVLALGLALALAGWLAGCSSHSTEDGMAAAAAPMAPLPAGAKLQWRALAAAGDDSAPVFDNAVNRFSEILQAHGVSHIERFTSDQTYATNDRPIATADLMTTAMDQNRPGPGEGCLVFLTSHGSRDGLLLRDDHDHQQILDPSTLGRMLDEGCGNAPTVAIVSGCFSGVFIGRVTEAPNRIILTAAREDRTSFGCGHEEQFTYFDDCLFRSWPQSQNWQALYQATDACVRRKEIDLKAQHSEPQAFFGDAVKNLALP